MTSVLKEEIIPRLNADVPNQPTEAALAMDDKLHRYMLVFDREGYGIAFSYFRGKRKRAGNRKG